MYYRRKILLTLLQVFGGSLTKMDLQKYLFLFNEDKSEPDYEFIPYHYGCYSFQANQDLSTLTKYKLVEGSEHHWRIIDKTKYLDQLKSSDRNLILSIYNRFNKLKGEELVRYVYETYPYYAINSKIAGSILDPGKYSAVLRAKPIKEEFTLFTIGYEGKSVEFYTNQLIRENVKVLCDVRKNPVSMKYGFSKNQLSYIIEKVGIKYIHFPELGIDSSKRQELNSQDDYEKLFQDYDKNTLPYKTEWIEKLKQIFYNEKRIALTCFEADYNSCHRSRISKMLSDRLEGEYIIKHI